MFVNKRSENQLDAKQVLSVIEKFNTALDLLDAYDHQTMQKPRESKAIYIFLIKTKRCFLMMTRPKRLLQIRHWQL